MKNRVNICWLRRDLRLIDQTALYHALNGEYPVLLFFIFDTRILNKLTDKKDRRVHFIYQALETINKEIAKRGSSLYILYDDPLSAFQKICNEYAVMGVFTNHDYEPYALDRDVEISSFLQTKSISFHSYKDQVIFEKSEVMKSDGSPYTVFTPYSKIWKQRYLLHEPAMFPSEVLLANLVQTEIFSFPSLEEIGFKTSGSGVKSLDINEEIILHYHETRDIPSLNGTSHLGVHLRFGTISIRQLVKIASHLNEQWLNELIWREFFMMILYHFPRVVNQSFKKKYDQIAWRNNEQEFGCWCRGETGYPIVDAGMRQLNETGWMHNRVRMIVASFLVKHLLIDWRWGEAYFAEKLIDYELASNNGNWQWAAGCGCDATPYFRIFSPSAQTKKFDPQLQYIKTWIKDYSPGYIEPIVEHESARKRALDVYRKALV
jgi:deoxyribodipyrimidine photo-lyase